MKFSAQSVTGWTYFNLCCTGTCEGWLPKAILKETHGCADCIIISWLAGCDTTSGELLDIDQFTYCIIFYISIHTHTSHTKVKRLVPLFPHLRSQPHAHDLEVPHHQLPAASLLAPNAKLFVWLVSFFQHMNVKRSRSDLANFDGTNSLEDLSSNGNLVPNVLDL